MSKVEKADSWVEERIQNLRRCRALNFYQSGRMHALESLRRGMTREEIQVRIVDLESCIWDDGSKKGEARVLSEYLRLKGGD